MAQPEVRVAEVSISFDVVKRLPDDALLLQEALIRHQEVQVALREDRGSISNTHRGFDPDPAGNCVRRHLVFDHRTEVVVSEEHGDLALLSRRVELTQTVI